MFRTKIVGETVHDRSFMQKIIYKTFFTFKNFVKKQFRSVSLQFVFKNRLTAFFLKKKNKYFSVNDSNEVYIATRFVLRLFEMSSLIIMSYYKKYFIKKMRECQVHFPIMTRYYLRTCSLVIAK